MQVNLSVYKASGKLKISNEKIDPAGSLMNENDESEEMAHGV